MHTIYVYYAGAQFFTFSRSDSKAKSSSVFTILICKSSSEKLFFCILFVFIIIFISFFSLNVTVFSFIILSLCDSFPELCRFVYNSVLCYLVIKLWGKALKWCKPDYVRLAFLNRSTRQILMQLALFFF